MTDLGDFGLTPGGMQGDVAAAFSGSGATFTDSVGSIPMELAVYGLTPSGMQADLGLNTPEGQARLQQMTASGSGGSGGVAGGPFRSTLRSFGLEELEPLIDGWVRDGLTWPEIEAMLYDTSTPAGKVVDRIYPELRMRREAGRTPMSIASIRSYRDTARQLMRAAGMPEGFYDQPEDFTRFIVSDISPAELQDRIVSGYQEALNAPPQVVSELKRLYGLGDGDVAAFFLDPDRAVSTIQRNVASAKIGGASQIAGYGNLSVGEAEGIAAQGVGFDQAGQRFGALVHSKELFNPLDRGEDAISREEQLGAVFSNSAAAQRRIEQRGRRRVARFEGGGALATSRQGFGGLSTSSDT